MAKPLAGTRTTCYGLKRTLSLAQICAVLKISLPFLWLTGLLLILSCRSASLPHRIFYSINARDSFEIYISLPPHYDSMKMYDVVYYCDANLKSGKLLREMLSDSQYATKVENTIFVGIGHIGDYHDLRRRDFILPHIENGDTLPRSAKSGQTERFYQFLKQELIPKINLTYNTNPKNNSILGHSLGGLFVFYCLFKNDSLFTNFYALSPSLWIDHYSIYKFNKLKQGINAPRHLYFSAGSLEHLNRIKNGTEKMDQFLNKEKYGNLNYYYQVHKGSTHNSQVKWSFNYILSN